MILALDIGNTYITVGGTDGKTIFFLSRLSTDRSKTEDEYKILLRELFALYRIDAADIEGAILSSVVPPLTNLLKNAVAHFSGEQPMVVGPGIKTGLNILTDNPGQLGTNLVVSAVAAASAYPLPQIIIHMETSTTLSILDGSGSFLGCQIFPGILVSSDALVAQTSQLPRISLEHPRQLIGRNTIDSMKSGLVYGYASMLDGMIERIEAELGAPATVIASGNNSGLVVPYCRRQDITFDQNLLINGLYLIYQKNKKSE